MRVVLGLLLLACSGMLVSAVTDVINADSANTFHITAGDFTNGWTFSASTNADPTLNLTRGTTYYFSIEFDSAGANHPFGLNTQMGPADGTQTVVEMGLINNGSCGGSVTPGYTATATTKCVLAFTPNATTPQPLYYHCGIHKAMWGLIQVNNASVPAATNPPTTNAPTTPVPGNTITADATNTFHLTKGDSTNGYTFAAATGEIANPTLSVQYGKTYTISIEFANAVSVHPFGLNTDELSTKVVDGLGLSTSAGNGTIACDGSATDGFKTATKCALTFTPLANSPQTIFYHCTLHLGMRGKIVISGLPAPTTPAPTTSAPTKPSGAGFVVLPGFAALFAVVVGLFAQ